MEEENKIIAISLLAILVVSIASVAAWSWQENCQKYTYTLVSPNPIPHGFSSNGSIWAIVNGTTFYFPLSSGGAVIGQNPDGMYFVQGTTIGGCSI